MKSTTYNLLSLTLGAILALSPSFAIAGSFTGTGYMQFARRRHTARCFPVVRSS